MNDATRTMAEEVADALSRFQRDRTGHAPRSVTVVLTDDTLVVTLHGALTPAEIELSRTEDGAARVQDYHRRLFLISQPSLVAEIARITGVAVKEAAVEIDPATGAVVHAFTSGAVVQVFRMEGDIPIDVWKGPAASRIKIPG
jgi:uncharacterized protein YbcI